MKNKNRDPIAIIGIGCKYPGDANTPKEFWKLICEKKDAICDIPSDRWDAEALYAPDFNRAGKMNVKKGGFIKEIDKFDAGFFGISPLEASRMDPQHRMLLEVTYHAIEDAGILLEELSGSRTCVFIGISSHDYGDIQNSPLEQVNIGAHTNVGAALCITANRISYTFNLKGPSLSIDTACSSSLHAIHLACRSIWSGESDLGFAGGVSAILKPEPQIGFSKGGFLSSDNVCRSFDAKANGYIRSEGAGIVFLKPLSQAKKDKDPIYAVIRGSAINQDGATSGISVPSQDAQEEMLIEAYKDAGVDPHKVQYVEAHGTGTLVGDPIEAGAIGKVIGTDRKDICYLGSIKSNIGHLEPASGVAGFTKVALAMKHRAIPPNIHYQTPNPDIPFDELKLKVPTKIEKWPNHKDGCFAGVNSFGFGGSNVHIVLEGLPNVTQHLCCDKGLQLFTVSARSPEALNDYAKSYIDFLNDKKNDASFNDICYSTGVRRTHHDNRLTVVAGSKKELAESLKIFLSEETLSSISSGRTDSKKEKIVFVFSGQGPQWWAMGRQLLKNEPLFRKTIKKLDAMLGKYADWSLIEELTRDEKTSRISETNIAQPAIFAIQIALYEMWKAVGITPDAVVGHSIGEVGA
ncbi:MAG TPA: type I polyketide synthase, partial [bacterium]|nr:type I polyketide synthase [bacterium]